MPTRSARRATSSAPSSEAASRRAGHPMRSCSSAALRASAIARRGARDALHSRARLHSWSRRSSVPPAARGSSTRARLPAAHLAALAGERGLVAALDIHAGGARRIRDEARRLGARVHGAVADARRPPFARPFDAVLVDAPCTGLGTLARHPELRWRRRPEDAARLAALQRDVLAAVAPLVGPGGILVYAVCTLTRDENEDVVDGFLAGHPRFVVEHASTLVPPELVTPRGFLRTLPHRHALDGFFAARLRLDSPASLR